MAKSSAERQAEYRARQQGLLGKRQLNVYLTDRSFQELERLCRRHRLSQQIMLELLFSDLRPWRQSKKVEKSSAANKHEQYARIGAAVSLRNVLSALVEKRRGGCD